MTTTVEPTTLDREAAAAQIEAWMQAGLPIGTVTPGRNEDDLILVQLSTPAQVDQWAAALGSEVRRQSWVYSIERPLWVDDLPGWRLDVFCTVPRLCPPVKIASRVTPRGAR